MLNKKTINMMIITIMKKRIMTTMIIMTMNIMTMRIMTMNIMMMRIMTTIKRIIMIAMMEMVFRIKSCPGMLDWGWRMMGDGRASNLDTCTLKATCRE